MPALERLIETFTEQTGIPAELEGVLGADRLPAPVETALYRIVQEALTNVIKHSRASRVSVLVTRKRSSITQLQTGRNNGWGCCGSHAPVFSEQRIST